MLPGHFPSLRLGKELWLAWAGGRSAARAGFRDGDARVVRFAILQQNIHILLQNVFARVLRHVDQIVRYCVLCIVLVMIAWLGALTRREDSVAPT